MCPLSDLDSISKAIPFTLTTPLQKTKNQKINYERTQSLYWKCGMYEVIGKL